MEQRAAPIHAAPLLSVRILAGLGILAGLVSFACLEAEALKRGWDLERLGSLALHDLAFLPFWFIAVALLWKGTPRSPVFTVAFVAALGLLVYPRIQDLPFLFGGLLEWPIRVWFLTFYFNGNVFFPVLALICLIPYTIFRKGRALLTVSAVLIALGFLCEAGFALQIFAEVSSSGIPVLSAIAFQLECFVPLLILAAWLIQVIREAVLTSSVRAPSSHP